MNKERFLSQKLLKELLNYCPETGIFTWLESRSRVSAGSHAGKLLDDYIMIGVNYKHYSAHRLAFLYMEGEFPPDMVDHINRNRGDNRWKNLRHATASSNQENRHNNCPFIGVYRRKNHQKWIARGAAINGKVPHIGTYITHIAACYARHAYDLAIENAK